MSYEAHGRAPADVRRASADSARRAFRIPEPVRPVQGEGQRPTVDEALDRGDEASLGRTILRRSGFSVIAPDVAGPERFDDAGAP